MGHFENFTYKAMEVAICLPLGSDEKLLMTEYVDAHEEDGYDDHRRFWIGRSSDEEDEEGEAEWLDYDEAVKVCGFVEGAYEGSNCLIEGNGPWAQGMISRRDFSTLAIRPSEKRERKRVSNLYWEAHKRGKAVAQLAK